MSTETEKKPNWILRIIIAAAIIGAAIWLVNVMSTSEIEIGGAKKNYIRNHPGFMLQEDAHRNMAFTLYHAYQTPNWRLLTSKPNN